MTKLYLVRHAKAGDRTRWEEPDDLRPLSKPGRKQADRLADRLADAEIERVVSSPRVRCRQTVEPLAQRLRLPVDLSDALVEGARLTDALALLDKVALAPAVLCTHGDVIGAVLEHLVRRGVPLGDDIGIAKGSTWVLHADDGEIVKARYLPPPK